MDRFGMPELPAPLADRPELAPLRWVLKGRPAAHPARKIYYGVLAKNLLLGEALEEILDRFQSDGIGVQPLKGALFVETLYGGDLGLRPMADLDLLVEPGSLSRAHAALVDLRFEPLGAGLPRWSPRFTHHQIYRRGPVIVELHFKLCHELAVDADPQPFFEQGHEITLRGHRLRIARDELQVYFVLLHAATHALRYSATWVVDAFLLVQKAGALDWSYIDRFAQAHKAQRLLHAAARYVNAFFPKTFPNARAPAGLRDAILERFLESAEPLDPSDNVRSLLIRSLLVERPADIAIGFAEKVWLRGLEMTLPKK